MKKILTIIIVCIALISGGCSAFRLAPDETQKANVYLLGQATQAAATLARQTGADENLCLLAELSAAQSGAVAEYYGVELGSSQMQPQQLLTEEVATISRDAFQNAAAQTSTSAIEGILEIGIGVCGIIGGAFGIKAAAFLSAARKKTIALQEIIHGNEDFKTAYPQYSGIFKQAHNTQSAATKEIVTELKSSKS